MKRQVIVLSLLLAAVGCGRNLQRDIYNRLVETFRLPTEETARDQFYATLKQRCGLPPDAVFLSYDYRTAPFVAEDKDLYVSAGVTVKAIARSPGKETAYLIHEEWYAAQHNWRPLLLRRSVTSVEERSNQSRPLMDEVATETVFQQKD